MVGSIYIMYLPVVTNGDRKPRTFTGFESSQRGKFIKGWRAGKQKIDRRSSLNLQCSCMLCMKPLRARKCGESDAADFRCSLQPSSAVAAAAAKKKYGLKRSRHTQKKVLDVLLIPKGDICSKQGASFDVLDTLTSLTSGPAHTHVSADPVYN